MAHQPDAKTTAPARPACRWWLPLAVFSVLLGCYWLTLAPTISGGDSAELATAVHVSGVAHPTGYPLYLLVGKLFDLIPLGEPARRVALLSAVTAAGAGALLGWAVLALTGSIAGGLLAGLASGLNFWVWAQANQAEVYGLHAFLLALAIALFVRWRARPVARNLALLALAVGLGLAHHRTSLFFGLPLLAWAAWGTRPRSARALARAAAWGLAPLLLYLWLPWRSAHHPLLDWGYTSHSLANFWEHVSGASYFQAYAFGRTPAEAAHALREMLTLAWVQFTVAGLALALVGMVALLARGRRPLGVCLLLAFALSGVWAAGYQVGDQWVFFLPPALVCGAWSGVGLAWLLERAARLKLSAGLARALPPLGLAASLLLPANMALQNWAPLNRSQAYRVLEQGEVMFSGIPGNALVLLLGDGPNFMASYYYHALGHHPVPTLLSARRITMPWYAPLLAPQLRRIAEAAPSLPEPGRWVWMVEQMRAALPPAQPLLTNIGPLQPPPGFVALDDYPLLQVVRDPGLELVAARDSRPLLALPAGAGALTGVSLPPRVTRGRPFPITLQLAWRQLSGMADLQLLFAHQALARQFAANPEAFAPRTDLVFTRPVPLLFGLRPPPSPPHRRYQQRFYALAPRSLAPGRYVVFCRSVSERELGPAVPVAQVQVD